MLFDLFKEQNTHTRAYLRDYGIVPKVYAQLLVSVSHLRKKKSNNENEIEIIHFG